MRSLNVLMNRLEQSERASQSTQAETASAKQERLEKKKKKAYRRQDELQAKQLQLHGEIGAASGRSTVEDIAWGVAGFFGFSDGKREKQLEVEKLQIQQQALTDEVDAARRAVSQAVDEVVRGEQSLQKLSQRTDQQTEVSSSPEAESASTVPSAQQVQLARSQDRVAGKQASAASARADVADKNWQRAAEDVEQQRTEAIEVRERAQGAGNLMARIGLGVGLFTGGLAGIATGSVNGVGALAGMAHGAFWSGAALGATGSLARTVHSGLKEADAGVLDASAMRAEHHKRTAGEEVEEARQTEKRAARTRDEAYARTFRAGLKGPAYA